MRRISTYLIAIVISVAAAAGWGAETVTYYHTDALGSPVAASDEAGNLLWREGYRPYGSRTQAGPATGSNGRWYTGHPHDDDSGLTYAGARYYDPGLGRFLSMDPAEVDPGDPATFNRYAYGNNNPYRYVDPDGRVPLPLLLVIGVGLEVANLAYEIYDTGVNPCGDCVVSSGAGIPAGLGSAAAKATGSLLSKGVPKGAKDLKPTLIKQNPRNLIPTQTKAEMSGSQVKRLTKDMKQNGFDQSKPVDAWRNPNTGRLEIQDGHHRTEAARKAGLDKIPVQVWE